MATFTEYAESILRSADLESKLLSPPEDLEDDAVYPDFATASSRKIPSNFVIPEEPARSERLSMSDTKSKIPRLEHLNDPRNVGITLHHFANHELMAIELFAWGLLKFRNAPQGVRKGFLVSLAEEQKHFKLYRDRMMDLGVSFGERPLNRLFWKQVPYMQTLEKFAAILSVSFEGANLDYSRIYHQAFQFHGDQESAGIMDIVYEDEIRHVKRGIAILRKSIPDGMDEWSYYQSLLSFPFTPRRAKGYYYIPDSRREAGLSENFIQNLGNYQDKYTGRVNLASLEKVGITGN